MRLVQDQQEEFQIIHLTGRREYYSLVKFYDKIKKRNCFVQDFYPETGVLYSAADIVISRAGALTLAEIAYYKLPAIVIPYPGAGAHQEANAHFFKEREAMYVFPENTFVYDQFKNTFSTLLVDEDLRDKIVKNIATLKVSVEPDEFFKAIFPCGSCA
jgi:UDP-N-acetylglucosamine--N-acetylmuramyl-(pentapeptide) pyrophosphoryl-undecaprenol N-acetylglucosamine transferase